MASAIFQSVMASVFENIGLTGLQPDSDGVYGIDVDGQYNVHIGGIDEHLLLFCKLGVWEDLEETRREELFQTNTPDSAMPHPVVTLDSDNVVFVWVREPLRDVTSTDVVQLLQGFLDQIDHRREMAFGEPVTEEVVHPSHMGVRA